VATVSKNIPQDLSNESFSPAQFGVDVGGWDAFAQALLDEKAVEVEALVGAATFNDADAAVALHVKQAERYLACAELWLRRMNQIDDDVAMDGQSTGDKNFQRFKTHHDTYIKKANAALAALPKPMTTPSESTVAPAFSGVATSHFEANPNRPYPRSHGHY